MKSTYYFSHDYNARFDTKIRRLILRHGMAGYGVFWAIIEDLYNNANALHLDCESIAFELRTDISIVQSVINDFDLFQIDGETFGSLSVERRLNERSNKSEKASKSANARWEKYKQDKGLHANALQPQSEGNAGKEKKGKEKKEKNNIFDFKNSLIELVNNETLVNDWLVVRKNKKCSNTETAFNGFLKQVELSGYPISDVLTKCIERSWGGFEAEWYSCKEKIDIKTHAPVWKFENGDEVTVLKDGSKITANDYYGNEMAYIDKVVNWRKCR